MIFFLADNLESSNPGMTRKFLSNFTFTKTADTVLGWEIQIGPATNGLTLISIGWTLMDF
jgi:hypothetical protein